MTRLATLKHINSKNADYGAAEQYLLFEHDEFTMKPVLDENGRLIPVSYTHLDVYKRQDLIYSPQLPFWGHWRTKRTIARKNNEKGGQPESCPQKPGGRLFRLLYAYET